MNMFTRTLSIFSLMLIALSGAAQTYDLAISAVTTAANPSNQVPAGMVAPITFTIKNNGSNAIPSGTEVWLAVEINSNYFINPDTLVFNGNFTPGGEISLTTTAGYAFEASSPNHQVCAMVYFVIASLEANPNNNELCETFVASSAAHNDWAAMSVSIEEPTNLDGFDLDNMTETVPPLDTAIVILQNNSNITFPFLYFVDYRLGLNGDTINISGQLSGPLGPGEQTTRIISTQNLPAVPQDSGTYQFCVIVNEEGDNVDTNDVSCESFTIIDSYDPFNPKNWPTGLDQVVQEGFQLIPSSAGVQIQGIQHTTDVTVLDMQGRLVHQTVIDEDQRIELDDAPNGVYIIQAADTENGQTEMKKFTKQ